MPVAVDTLNYMCVQEAICAWGWQCSMADGESTCWLITHVPIICGQPLTVQELKRYLSELAAVPSAGAGSIPGPILDVLRSVACRRAVMFGDELCDWSMASLITSLQAAQLPFHCAHGRPTACGVVDLQSFVALRQLRGSTVPALPHALSRAGGQTRCRLDKLAALLSALK